MIVDIVIVLVLAAAGYRSRGGGFLRQFCASVGFFGGLFLGRVLEPYSVNLGHTPQSRAFITILTIFGLGLICLIIGELIGIHLKYRLIGSKGNHVDNAFGIVLSVVTILLVVWLLAAAADRLPTSELTTDIGKSYIIKTLDKVLPPVPTVISDLGQLIDPNGFPDVFIGSEPIPRGNVSLPQLGDLAAAVNADKDSVVRIQGTGCGGLVSGSGFVVGNDLVATNAHVVAGIIRPYVQDVNGTHRAQVIWFDPNLDFAVLRVNGLAGKALSIDTNLSPSGTPGAVLGYPGGGNFTAKPAAILDQFEASGHNIYGNGVTLRSVYEVQSDIIPGNSGGPLVTKSGSVMGVVFAESTSYKDVGYALTMSKIASEINQASKEYGSVSTGKCAE